MVAGSQAGTALEVTGLVPGQTYYFTFYSENFSYYSAGATASSVTLAVPQAKNSGAEGVPQAPAAVFLGDSGLTFGLDSWGPDRSQLRRGAVAALQQRRPDRRHGERLERLRQYGEQDARLGRVQPDRHVVLGPAAGLRRGIRNRVLVQGRERRLGRPVRGRQRRELDGHRQRDQ